MSDKNVSLVGEAAVNLVKKSIMYGGSGNPTTIKQDHNNLSYDDVTQTLSAKNATVTGTLTATGFTTLTTLDAVAAPVADVSLNSHKVTSLAAGTLVADAVNVLSVQAASYIYVVDSGAANAYVATVSPAWTAYAAGKHLFVKIANANTGAATINVSGLGVKSIKTQAGADPGSGVLATGGIYHLMYDGTNFQTV